MKAASFFLALQAIPEQLSQEIPGPSRIFLKKRALGGKHLQIDQS
jgi:hypothetical protein